jgi:hypothetical protein
MRRLVRRLATSAIQHLLRECAIHAPLILTISWMILTWRLHANRKSHDKNIIVLENYSLSLLLINGMDCYPPGSVTLPTNNIVPVELSRIRKKNGRSTVNSTRSEGREVASMIAVVAAAASVPASSTAT